MDQWCNSGDRCLTPGRREFIVLLGGIAGHRAPAAVSASQ
jgi:hypothetical protein